MPASSAMRCPSGNARVAGSDSSTGNTGGSVVGLVAAGHALERVESQNTVRSGGGVGGSRGGGSSGGGGESSSSVGGLVVEGEVVVVVARVSHRRQQRELL